MRNRTIFIFIVLLLTVLTPPNPAFAQASKGLGCGGGFGPIAEFLCTLNKGTVTGPNDPAVIKVANKFNTVFSGIISFLTVIAGLWFLFRFIIAGINWIGAGGDKAKIEQAQDAINNALIGLVIVVGAWVIVGIVGTILGLDILNPGNILRTVGF